MLWAGLSTPFFENLDLGSLVYFQVYFRRNDSKNLGLVSFQLHFRVMTLELMRFFFFKGYHCPLRNCVYLLSFLAFATCSYLSALNTPHSAESAVAGVTAMCSELLPVTSSLAQRQESVRAGSKVRVTTQCPGQRAT